MTEYRKNISSEPREGISCEVNKRCYTVRIGTRKFSLILLSFGLASSYLFDIVWSHYAIFGKDASVVVGLASFSQAVCSA